MVTHRPARPFLGCGTVPTSLPNSNWPESCRYELGAWICRLVRLDLDRTWALLHSPLILLRLHTMITVHAQTAAQQQSNGNFEARMSEKCGEWRD